MMATYGYQYRIPFLDCAKTVPRKSSKDVFHGYMTKAIELSTDYEIPVMQSELEVPKGVISFSDAMRQNSGDFDRYVHFYEHDSQIERFWNSPWKYLPKLSGFSGFISPDFSSAPDMPMPQRQFNVYRNQLMGAWLQNLGYRVICNARCPALGHQYSLSGTPKNSLIAVGAVGCIKNRDDRHRFEGGLIRLVDELEPAGLIIVGEDSYGIFDYPRNRGISLYFYHGTTQKRFEVLHHER